MPRRIGFWSLAILLAGLAGQVRADLVISVGSATVPQGGTGTVDVFLSSTASTASPDPINNLAFTLQITGPNELMFSTTQGFGYLNDPHYVFSGDSTDQNTSSGGGSVTTTSYANDTFIGSDSTFSGNPVSLSSSSGQVLLASLNLDASITNLGDVYTIGLVPGSGDGSINSSASTYFDVFNFSTGSETSAVPFSSMSGTVTIGGAAVPEPASIISGLIAMVTVAGFHGAPPRSRRRRHGDAVPAAVL